MSLPLWWTESQPFRHTHCILCPEPQPPPPPHTNGTCMYVMSFPNPNPDFRSWVELALSQCMQLGVDSKNCSGAPPLLKSPKHLLVETLVLWTWAPIILRQWWTRWKIIQCCFGGFFLSADGTTVCPWAHFMFVAPEFGQTWLQYWVICHEMFFFFSSFWVFPYSNKIFYWEELSPVWGKTLQSPWSECDSVTRHDVLQAVKDGKNSSITIPDLGIFTDLMKLNHCVWMQNKKSECFQGWQVF